MTTWVLVLAMYGQGKALDHIEFKTREYCEKAASQFEVGKWDSLFAFSKCIEADK